MSAIFLVQPANLAAIWPRVEALLKPSLEICRTHTPEDIRRSIMSGHSQLWVQADMPNVEAVIVSEFVQYPRGLYVRAWLAGADADAPLEDELVFEMLDKWRLQHACIGMEIIGRHGWLRRVPGLRIDGLVMRKEFD